MNYRVGVFVILLSLGTIMGYAQNNKETYIKGNAATLLIGMPHFGVETSLGAKSTFQIDAIASFWESINRSPLKFLIITPEYRYYFKQRFQGWYAGAHLGGTTFKLSKFFRKNSAYQKGVGYTLGATIGFQKKISHRVNLDFFLGGGMHQGFYKGYNRETGDRGDGAIKYNKSGEWFPYRGGLMLSYKLN
ncbi:DUF3575 domain-containing protein [Algibacter pacificus]|uniref:DUF3575 domain-containing protein n=1 Tax=Algibacter pacificus TaxID=2599389 RepID=UPI002938DBDD|nr:DUF3575 domain-containing protein [Algibacter pacificus]